MCVYVCVCVWCAHACVRMCVCVSKIFKDRPLPDVFFLFLLYHKVKIREKSCIIKIIIVPHFFSMLEKMAKRPSSLNLSDLAQKRTTQS